MPQPCSLSHTPIYPYTWFYRDITKAELYRNIAIVKLYIIQDMTYRMLQKTDKEQHLSSCTYIHKSLVMCRNISHFPLLTMDT